MGEFLVVYFRVWAWETWLTVLLPYMSDMSLSDMVDCKLILYEYGEMFYCILPVYEIGRHRWHCTYHTWEISVCTKRLSIYLSYTIMENFLIVYTSRVWSGKTWLTVLLPYMRDICVWDMAVCIIIVCDYGGIFSCILPVYELGRHGWLCDYHIWVIWVYPTWLIVNLSYTIMMKCLIVYRVWTWKISLTVLLPYV